LHLESQGVRLRHSDIDRRSQPDVRCPQCGKVGFVRHENVVKGTRAERQLLCGRCDHEWSVVDTRARPRKSLTLPPDSKADDLSSS
jgi:hypothetical protein